MKTALLCVAFSCFSVAAAEPKVSNRQATADEIGYRPADGSISIFNPPSFTWLHENGAVAYAVQWSTNADFSAASSVSRLPFNTYTHNQPLVPGKYYWRYSIANGTDVAAWSVTRSFVIRPGSVEFPMPNRKEQMDRVPKQHPRLFLRPEDLPRLRSAAQNSSAPAGAQFKRLRGEADKLVTTEPIEEPTVRGSNRDDATRSAWWPNRVQTEKACQEAEVAAFVFLITGEKQYGENARKRILHLASWDPDGPTNFKLNCEAAKPMLFRLPRAYDWAYSALTDADRDVVRRVMVRRAKDAWESGEIGRAVGHLNRPYNSHGNRVFHKIGEAGIAFLGEIPEAETWLDYALNKFFAAYPVWCDDDGGWHEGTSYWAGYMSKIVWWLQVSQSALQIDGFKKPFFAQVGDFPLYTAPPGSPNMGFGDLSSGTPSAGTGAFMEFFERSMGARPEGSRAGYWRWWTEQWKMNRMGGILGFLYEANLPGLPAPKPPVDLPSSKVFRGIGVASLHTCLTNSSQDVHFLFKSSPFGGQSHGHNAQNTFQLNAYGEALLPACVYRDYHGSKFHYQWCHSTRAQNGVLVDGIGQIPHSAAAKGNIVEFRSAPEFDYVVGDATEAYGGRLRSCRRSVAFLKPDLIVICDDLVATNEVSFQFMLHALQPFEFQEQDATVKLERNKAGLMAQYLSPIPLRLRQWDGYEPKPTREFPNQWHLEAATTHKSSNLQVFTILAPHRAGGRADFKAQRLESANAVGVRVEREGVGYTVAFRKTGGSATADLEGVTLGTSSVGFKRMGL